MHAQPRRRPSRERDPPGAARRAALARRAEGPERGASTSARAARASRLSPGRRWRGKPPTWVMVAELVETSRLWGRTAARIDPRWVEPLAEHLVKRTYERAALGRASAARSSRPSASTLYGLPIVAGRTVAVRARSTRRSRASCSSAARWSRATGTTRHAFFAENRAAASRRSRRSRTARGGATSSSTTRRCTPSTTRGSRPTSSPARTSTAGGATSGARDPDLLTFTRELLVTRRRGGWTRGPAGHAGRRASSSCAQLPLRARAPTTTA